MGRTCRQGGQGGIHDGVEYMTGQNTGWDGLRWTGRTGQNIGLGGILDGADMAEYMTGRNTERGELGQTGRTRRRRVNRQTNRWGGHIGQTSGRG